MKKSTKVIIIPCLFYLYIIHITTAYVPTYLLRYIHKDWRPEYLNNINTVKCIVDNWTYNLSPLKNLATRLSGHNPLRKP